MVQQTGAATRTTTVGRPRLRARVPGARPPARLVTGLGLVGVNWWLYWTLATDWSPALFFGLWLGYILTADGLVHRRTGTSPLDRGAGTFVLTFAVSVPFWWAFEWCNWAVGNWSYKFPAPMDRTSHILIFSLAFSTVLPALVETAELVGSTRLFQRRWQGPRIQLERVPIWAVSAVGAVAFGLMLLMPRQLFILLWIFPLLLLDPVNSKLGRPSLWAELRVGRWRLTALSVATGFVCGFFWEMWNSQAAGIRWEYFLPSFLSHPHLFAMPLPGYLGYPPFTASAFAATSFAGLLSLSARSPKSDRQARGTTQCAAPTADPSGH